MTKQNQITIKMDARTAATVRQILFEHQDGYSYEFPSERINIVRDLIRSIDNLLTDILVDN